MSLISGLVYKWVYSAEFEKNIRSFIAHRKLQQYISFSRLHNTNIISNVFDIIFQQIKTGK
jgi:hypothetical protein